MASSDLGSTLRDAREQQRLSLREIADRTSIPPRVLDAIERNAFDQIPGGLFARSYLRAYASAVGIDGERIVGDYLSQVEAPEPDVLDLLRVRLHPRTRDLAKVFQFLLVMAGLVCLVFLLMRERSPVASGDAEHDEQLAHPLEVSSVIVGPPVHRLARL